MGGTTVVTRNRSKFTRQQVDAFQANPYTYRISESTIRFTLEFKKEFWKRYQAGQSPSRILTDLGYDVDALGKRRIQAIRDHIRKEAASPEGLHEGNAPCRKRRPHSTDYSSVPKDQAVELMQHELLYLRQEMEFVKKIMNAGNSPKQGG